MRWYKFKSMPEEKWAVQFAFSPPYQYCVQCATKYNEENHHLYRPVSPKKPHPTSLRTPKDYLEEEKKLTIQAEKLQKKKEKDLARGIPQVVIDKFNLMTPEHETEQQRKCRIQVI